MLELTVLFQAKENVKTKDALQALSTRMAANTAEIKNRLLFAKSNMYLNPCINILFNHANCAAIHTMEIVEGKRPVEELSEIISRLNKIVTYVM